MSSTQERVAMANVSMVERRSPVLASSGIACLSRIPTVNVSAGCAHGCLYCYTRGYGVYPGKNQVEVYENLVDKLKAELPRKRKRPAAVYFSPSSDAFQPVPEVLEVTYRAFDYLLSSGVEVAFLTKGAIPNRHLELIKAHADNVSAQVGLITLDQDILSTFEPGAAPARQRLSRLKELKEAGVATGARIDPVLPGITDREESLRTLFEAIAETGVNTVAASVLFLRPAVTASLKDNLADRKMLATLFNSFSNSEPMEILAESSRVRALPREDRNATFERMRKIAGDNGMDLKICACKNPDLASGSCSIAGNRRQTGAEPEQMRLFEPCK